MAITGHEQPDQAPPSPEPPSFVYYLMVGPSTVKIGTTRDLRARLGALRTEKQYIAALELGGQPLEAQRHKQFAAERIGRRENFQLSKALKQHIESLQPRRTGLLRSAIPQLSRASRSSNGESSRRTGHG